MSFILPKSTKTHFASLGTPTKGSTSARILSSNGDPSCPSRPVAFPDSRFLSALRKCQNSLTNILKIRVPKQGFMRFSSRYKHTHQNTIRELIETFLDEYGCSESTHEGAGGIMESCGVEIRLCDEVGELVVVVGDVGGKKEGCCSVRISRPELGCRISLDIQTRIRTTLIPFKKTKETQFIILSLESLPSSSYSNTNSTPSSPASLFYSPPKRFLDIEGSEADIGLGSGLDFGNGIEKDDMKGMGKVYTCFKWNTVRVFGMSFCWGADYVADVDVNAPSRSSKRGRCGLVRRALRSLGAARRNERGERAVGLSGLESKSRDVGEEGKPLLV